MIHHLHLQALRKEKSRNAARSRRGKENFEFFELAKMLPLPGAITSQLDKASIIRLTISYLKMRDFANQGDPPWNVRAEGTPSSSTSVKALGAQGRRNSNPLISEIFEQHLGGHILQSLDGFVLALNQEGRFLYISETVSIYLGLSQVELTGSSVFDYIHPGDHIEMAEQLGMKPPGGRLSVQPAKRNLAGSTASSPTDARETGTIPSASPLLLDTEGLERSFFIRMKSTLTKRGLHVKTSGYKVIHVTGRLRPRLYPFSPARSASIQVMGMVALAHTLPPSTLSEVRIECHMFVFRVNMDLQIVYCESRVSDYMDMSPADLIGKSCYHFVHGEDVEGIRHSHLDLLKKGQVVTKYYRWLQKAGGYIWLQSCATISVNVKNPSERNIVWVNYILSKPEYKNIPMDLSQLPASSIRVSDSGENSDLEQDFKERDISTDASKGSRYPEVKDLGSKGRRYLRSQSDERTSSLEDTTSESPEAKCEKDYVEESEDEIRSDTENRFAPSGGKRIKLELRPEGGLDAGEKSLAPLRDVENSGSSSDEDEEGAEAAGGCRNQKGCKREESGSPSLSKGLDSCRPRTAEFSSVIQSQASFHPQHHSALKIKSEQTLPGGYDNGNSMWSFHSSREAPREALYTMNKALSAEKLNPRQAAAGLYVAIPDSVLTPPEVDSGGSVPKAPFSTSPRAVAPAALADTLSPPLSGSPCEEKASSAPFAPVVYSSEMEVLQRLHAGNMVLPLVHQIGAGLTAHNPMAGTSAPQGLYTTSTIRYAPADMTLAMQGNMLPASHALNLADINGSDSKSPMELMYHHIQRLNMVAPFGNVGGGSGGAGLAQVPGTGGGVFTTAETLFSALPFSMNSSSIHSAPALERKEN
nr:PREDICTED: neuronal PAS domain-containing protein 1 [Latimeria chalumnae]|eukprot:XP_005996103.1 PREDICTED: neuronal PAS domain-containing protein 1 [Latimeria chalumnae]